MHHVPIPFMTSLFSRLPHSVQRRIDRAFNRFLPHGKKLPKSSPDLDTGGGFMIDAGLGGGFIPALDGEASEAKQQEIPFSSISAALELLDLPPDDEQVLAIFHNAASGWVSSSLDGVDRGQNTEGAMISQDDWRSVCAVLLENHQEMEGANNGAISSGSDDQYHDSGSSSGTSDVEYEGDLPQSGSRRRRRGHRLESPSSLDTSMSNRPLTKSQQQVALEAFALFFPSVPESELANQKIMLKDLQRISKLIGEKIKAQEMVEMLECFSTLPDKSIGFSDFGRIMVVAKLA